MKKYNIVVFVTLTMALLFAGCGILDDDDSTVIVPVYTTPIGDLSGTTWSVEDYVNGTACGDGYYYDYYSVEVVSQSGNTISVSTPVGTFSGTFSDDQISWSGSYAQSGGTTVSNTSLTVNSVCSTLSGTATWTWSNGVETCAGTSAITATRNDAGGC
jgi:hypothetical protein